MEFIQRRTTTMKYALKQFFILTLIFDGIKFKLAELTVEETSSDMTTQCLLHIIRSYFNESKKISLTYDHNRTHVIIVDQLFKLLHIPLMLNANEFPMGTQLDTRIPSDVTIIFGHRTNITRYLEANLFTSRTVFLTILWEKPETVKSIFEQFWRYNIVNTFALMVGEDEINVYHFVPYAKCNESEPMILDHWSDNRFKYGKIDRIGKKNPVSDLNGCRFNVSVTNVPPTIIFPNPEEVHGSYFLDGIEGRILKTISEKLNGSFLYKVADDGQNWGFITPRPSGVIGDVFLKKSIISCGLTAPRFDRMTHLDGVVGCSAVSECVSWLVPVGSGKGKPVWIHIYIGEFSLSTWLLLSLTITSMLACFTFFSWLEKSPKSISENFLMFCSSSLGVSVRPPKSRRLKILFAAWIWYGLVIQTAYESSVKSRLTVPLSRKNIDTFAELLESDLELCGIPNTIRMIFQGNEDPDSQAIGKRVKGTNKTIDEIVEEMLEKRLTGYLREYTTFLYNAYKNKKAVGEIHRVKRCAIEYNPTLYLQKRSPVTHKVKRVVRQLLESGILHHWRQWYLREGSRSSSSSSHIKLTLRHIAAPFITCLVGLSLSIVAFIIEYVTYVYVDMN